MSLLVTSQLQLLSPIVLADLLLAILSVACCGLLPTFAASVVHRLVQDQLICNSDLIEKPVYSFQ